VTIEPKNPRRAAEAGRNGLAGDRLEVHDPTSAAAVAGVAHVFEQSRQGFSRVGLLHGAHGDLSSPLRARNADPQPAAAGALQCDAASDRRMDSAATARSVRAGGGAEVSDFGIEIVSMESDFRTRRRRWTSGKRSLRLAHRGKTRMPSG